MRRPVCLWDGIHVSIVTFWEGGVVHNFAPYLFCVDVGGHVVDELERGK